MAQLRWCLQSCWCLCGSVVLACSCPRWEPAGQPLEPRMPRHRPFIHRLKCACYVHLWKLQVHVLNTLNFNFSFMTYCLARFPKWFEKHADICVKTGGFSGGASGKEPTCQCRRHKRHGFDSWVGKTPWRSMATHSSILAWRIPWIAEPGGLQSIGSQKNRIQLSHWRTMMEVYRNLSISFRLLNVGV